MKAAPARAAVPRNSSALGRIFAGLPDLVTALAFLATWIAPATLGAAAVKTGVLVVLMEFFVIHSTGFMLATAFNERVSSSRRTLAVLGFAAFYALFVALISMIFDEWWPLLALAWLVGAKVSLIWFAPLDRGAEQQRQMGLLAVSTAAYLFAVILTVAVPMPSLGITGTGADYGLSGGGVWIDKPYTAIAGGTIYFALLAWAKLGWKR